MKNPFGGDKREGAGVENYFFNSLLVSRPANIFKKDWYIFERRAKGVSARVPPFRAGKGARGIGRQHFQRIFLFPFPIVSGEGARG